MKMDEKDAKSSKQAKEGECLQINPKIARNK